MTYFQQNVRGTWHEVCKTDIVSRIYRLFEYIPWTNSYYFILNFNLDPMVDDEITKYEKIVLSAHFQTMDEKKLFDLFSRFPNKSFLLIIDQDREAKNVPGLSDIFANVEVLSWITWHHQLDFTIKQVGVNNCPNKPQKLLSCLSSRQDIHKRIVTAFILRNFQPQDVMCSWHRLPSANPYWLDPDLQVPPRLKELLHAACLDEARYLDDYQSQSRSIVLQWQSQSFVNCLINVCLESQFNDVTQWQNHSFKIPGPMFTEKTWKPILAGQCFLPVGQGQSCAVLTEHGFSFDFLDDLSFDSLIDFDRLNAILDVLDWLRLADRDEIESRCRAASLQNLDLIKSGDFTTSCDKHNESMFTFLQAWVEQT